MFSDNTIPKHKAHRYVGKDYDASMQHRAGCDRLFKAAIIIIIALLVTAIGGTIMTACNGIANIIAGM